MRASGALSCLIPVFTSRQYLRALLGEWRGVAASLLVCFLLGVRLPGKLPASPRVSGGCRLGGGCPWV